MKNQEEVEKKDTASQFQRYGFLVTGFLVAFMVLGLYLFFCWNWVAESLHFPTLSYLGAVGLLGLVLFVAAVPTAVYLTCVKEFE
ncbi:MAG: hypothetical protein KGL39_46765 [Patescibacteria group bacterium]|nr:hypothetical protein [Patescibacteria group bacterium]